MRPPPRADFPYQKIPAKADFGYAKFLAVQPGGPERAATRLRAKAYAETSKGPRSSRLKKWIELSNDAGHQPQFPLDSKRVWETMGLLDEADFISASQYLTEANGYPVELDYSAAADGLAEVPDGPFRGHRWAEPSRSSLRAALRAVVARPADARARGDQARRDMVRRFSPRVLAAVVEQHLARIGGRLDAAREAAHADLAEARGSAAAAESAEPGMAGVGKGEL